MTTDKTPATLATAKPGGCVQLGDWPSIEERARELLAAEYAMAGSTKRADKIIAGFDCAPGTEYALRAIVAALSAQPSPGGQADAQLRTCGDERPCINCYSDQGNCLGPAPSQIAARQPVGKIVGYMDPEEDFILPTIDSPVVMGKITLFRSPADKWTKPLYDGPPAQAVDLGELREAIRKAWQKSASNGNIDLEFGKLLALIDSHSGSKL